MESRILWRKLIIKLGVVPYTCQTYHLLCVKRSPKSGDELVSIKIKQELIDSIECQSGITEMYRIWGFIDFFS